MQAFGKTGANVRLPCWFARRLLAQRRISQLAPYILFIQGLLCGAVQRANAAL